MQLTCKIKKNKINKINKKHILHNKESLFGVGRWSLSCQSLPEHHKDGEREVSGTAMFVAPSKTNRFQERSYRAVLALGVWGLLGALAGPADEEEDGEEGEPSPPPPPPGERASAGHRRLTKTFLLFLHELIYGRLESSSSLRHRMPAESSECRARLG